jgi:hypothetical protein
MRSYVNRLARFSSPDPAGLAAVDPSNPQSWNRYAYVSNNPSGFIDPTGLVCNGVNNTMEDTLSNGTGIFDQQDCAANGGTWSNQGGCMVDGAEVSCQLAMNLLSSPGGAATTCPNNDCSGLVARQGPGDTTVFQTWVPPSITNPLNPGDPIQVTTGYWQTLGTSTSSTSGLGLGPNFALPNSYRVQPPTLMATPTLKFKPPSWQNFTHDFLPCYGGQLLGNFVGNDDRATVTFGTVALFSLKPFIGGPLLVAWTAVNAFKAGSACALASRAVYQ